MDLVQTVAETCVNLSFESRRGGCFRGVQIFCGQDSRVRRKLVVNLCIDASQYRCSSREKSGSASSQFKMYKRAGAHPVVHLVVNQLDQAPNRNALARRTQERFIRYRVLVVAQIVANVRE